MLFIKELLALSWRVATPFWENRHAPAAALRRLRGRDATARRFRERFTNLPFIEKILSDQWPEHKAEEMQRPLFSPLPTHCFTENSLQIFRQAAPQSGRDVTGPHQFPTWKFDRAALISRPHPDEWNYRSRVGRDGARPAVAQSAGVMGNYGESIIAHHSKRPGWRSRADQRVPRDVLRRRQQDDTGIGELELRLRIDLLDPFHRVGEEPAELAQLPIPVPELT